MNTINSIEEKIIQTLKQVEERLILENRKPTTTEILEPIGDLGHSLDYDVCLGECKPKFDNQWLFDLVWYKNDENNFLISVPLVVESELKLGLIDHKVDFEKLLISNSQYKLMICQVYTDDIESRFEYFQKAINLYKDNRLGDSYLIVFFDYYTHKIIFRKLSKT